MATPGTGTTVHLAGEMLMAATGIRMTHVPYRGGAPALVDLIAGQVQVLFDVVPGSLPHVQAGAIRALAVTSMTRWPALPDVATVAETIAGFEAMTWFGIGAPRGTPPEIIARLNREINAGLVNPTNKARLADVATTPILFTPAEFGGYMAAEVEKWGKVIRASGIRPE